jgi:sucrose-6F-phosphate phosphohydrolase
VAENFLLISDLDDTLLGDQPALGRFEEYRVLLGPRLSIAYASGRFFDSVCEDVGTTPLPQPIAVLGGVGSEMRSFPDGQQNQAWIEQMSVDWSAETVRELLAAEADLEPQPEEFQSAFKMSYFLRDASVGRLDELREKLGEAGVRVDCVYSSNRDLDFLPHGVNKGTAAAFLARELGFDNDHVVVAGNSGNDSKLFEHGFHGVIVANAHNELKQYADDSRNYLSPHERADGVRDGLEHWMKRVSNGDQ